ncbi:MAG: hypothetical protein KTR16_00875 [Acidiferrobacterales bacterium]|nr:hypothetical protein [Acidiferrobacterales bacterium]
MDGLFSEHIVVYSEIAKQAILDCSETLWSPVFEGQLHFGYGTETRHEGSYSTVQTIANRSIGPFGSMPMRKAINVKDQVSFDIVNQHLLDFGESNAAQFLQGYLGFTGISTKIKHPM